MKLFQLLQQKSRYFYFFLVVLGLSNTLWSVSLLILINSKITDTPLPFASKYDWAIYLGTILSSFLITRYFQAYMIRLTYSLGQELSVSLFEKLRFSNYEEFLKLGKEKIRTVIADVSVLQRFPQAFVETFNAMVLVLIGIVYLFFISPLLAVVVTVVLALLVVVYSTRNEAILKIVNSARDLDNQYQQSVNDFLLGFREMKLSQDKSDTIYHQHLSENRDQLRRRTVNYRIKYMHNELFGNYVFYLLIGLVLFALPLVLPMSVVVKSNFIVTLLYLLAPIAITVGLIKEFAVMQVALGRIDQLNEQINASQAIAIKHGEKLPIDSFESLRFEHVTYEYAGEGRSSAFKLPPLNIEIAAGECLFITGGNGSGKSTFINLLTGLYLPQSGSISLNGHLIKASNYPFYRNQLAAIYADGYFFERNYEKYPLHINNPLLTQWIEKMKLSHVVSFHAETGELETVSSALSSGQQKRLALIYAILEGKSILVLDEWAAEQDPVFRAYFYKEIIQDLKKMGKTIIAVTHDDAYFNCADRIVRFDYGRIVYDYKVLELTPETAL